MVLVWWLFCLIELVICCAYRSIVVSCTTDRPTPYPRFHATFLSRAQESSAKTSFPLRQKKITEIKLSRSTSSRGGHIWPQSCTRSFRFMCWFFNKPIIFSFFTLLQNLFICDLVIFIYACASLDRLNFFFKEHKKTHSFTRNLLTLCDPSASCSNKRNSILHAKF
jgi:hypothetical protein